jgi:hypothetical protein
VFTESPPSTSTTPGTTLHDEEPVEVQRRLVGFQRRYEQTAVPFDWRFTRADLQDLLRRLDEKQQLAEAA